jgi:hypothetical protein
MFRSLFSVFVPNSCRGGSLDPLLSSPRLASTSLFSLLYRRFKKSNPLFSYSSALNEKEYFANSFPIKNFRTILQNTRDLLPSSKIWPLHMVATHGSPHFAISFGMRSFAKSAHNLFRMRSFKTKDLKSCRMSIYEKTRVGVSSPWRFLITFTPRGNGQPAGAHCQNSAQRGRVVRKG